MSELADFCIIGVRVNKPESTGKKILVDGALYTMLKGYDIEGDEIRIRTSEACISSLYNGYIGQYHIRNVAISAIVGANGSGKSTVVEFIFRLINNFAAALFGEKKLYPSAERIHFVEGVYGELYFMLDQKPHRLIVEGNQVNLFVYTNKEEIKEDDGEKLVRFIQEEKPIFERNDRNHVIGGGMRGFTKWKKGLGTYQKVADHFFYTFVSNYSMYAYNRNDFTDEFDTDKIGCWLDGIFHKNDGYQTPIVLTPYREKGNMDVNKEALLSNERLVALLLQDVGFKRLNGHLEVVGLIFEDIGKDYGVAYLNGECETNFSKGCFTRLRYCISEAWKSKYNCKFQKEEELELYQKALDYLASKTIKVAMKYSQYREFFDRISGITKRPKAEHKKALRELIDALAKDDSHITTKIRQTLGYLVRGNFKDSELTLEQSIDKCRASLHGMKDAWRDDEPMMFGKLEDTLPAPFIKVTIKLKEDNNTELTLDKLSSGERQQIFSISSILYHLSNISSVHNDRNKKRVEYKRVCVVLEEIELYFHPELQRQFVRYLLDGLRQVRMENLLAVNVIIVTHSPFVLSDIATSNILPLEDGKRKDRKLQSFGANIHDILNSNFFMEEGAKGLFAEWVISEIVKVMTIYKKDKEERTDDDQHFIVNYSQKKLCRLINTIDEPIIKRLLAEQYDEIFSKDAHEMQIKVLEAQLQDLKNRRE